MADNAKNNPQKYLFEYIKNISRNRVNIVDDISTLLNISNDAAYRRIRGEKQLSLDELVKISQYYNLSIDSILNSNFNDIRFTYIPLLEDFHENYLIYLNRLRNQLSDVAKQEKKKIYFAAGDIPIFHLCKYPSLKAFKSYTWVQQLGGNITKYQKNNFFDEKYIQLYQDIYSLYRGIDSYEIWTFETLDSYLKLIKYYAEIDCFENPHDGLELCDDLLNLVDDIKAIGETEYDSDVTVKGRTHLFLSEIDLDNKFVYVETDKYKLTFITLFSLNNMKITHEIFCDETEKWFKSITNKSMLISGFSQKQFLIFIKELKNKIEHTRKKLVCLISN